MNNLAHEWPWIGGALETTHPITPAKPAAADGQPKISSQQIVPFINSTKQVFSTMVGVQVAVGKPHIKTDSVGSFDVSGIIGFSGEILGSVVISMQLKAASNLVKAFAGGMEIEPGSADFADAIGEIANMVAGAAKKDLGLIANITVPTVIVGAGHHIARLSGVPCVVIPCESPAGNFAVEVNIKAQK
jgi:chemotaxis protein CheX